MAGSQLFKTMESAVFASVGFDSTCGAFIHSIALDLTANQCLRCVESGVL